VKLELTLRSGARVTADVEELSFGHSQLSHQPVELSWRTPVEWTRKLEFINLAEVVAAVVVRDSSTSFDD
jgi:hypothetical protein